MLTLVSDSNSKYGLFSFTNSGGTACPGYEFHSIDFHWVVGGLQCSGQNQHLLVSDIKSKTIFSSHIDLFFIFIF